MKPYKAVCPFCGDIFYGYDRQHAYDQCLRHCRDTKNHPQVEPYLIRITSLRFWLYKASEDKERIKQIERHAASRIRTT